MKKAMKQTKARYVDGFVIPIPKKKIKEYQKISRQAGKVWMEYGALDYKESVGDDLKTPFGISFSKLAKVKPGETVVFAWITYKSKAHRNKVNAQVMKDPRITCAPDSVPFDIKRMSFGGFEIFVDAQR